MMRLQVFLFVCLFALNGGYYVCYPSNAVLKIGEYLSDIPQFKHGDFQSCETFQPIVHKLIFLMDYNYYYFVALG